MEIQIPKKYGKISPAFRKRIYYYSRASAMQNMWFTLLCSKKTTQKEHEAAFWMGVLAPAQDDLTDNLAIDFLRIKALTENLNTKPNTVIEFLLQYSAQKIISCVSNKHFFMEMVQKTHLAQLNSRKQFELYCDRNILKTIEFEKSSKSTLLCRLLISKPLEKNETEFVAHFGFFMQYLNDIFDIYKDYKQQVFTMANSVDDIEILKIELDGILEKVIYKLSKSEYKISSKKQFLSQLLLVASLGYVSLEQYKNIQKNEKFLIHKYSRKQLICDMETPNNIYKSLKYTIKLHKIYFTKLANFKLIKQ